MLNIDGWYGVKCHFHTIVTAVMCRLITYIENHMKRIINLMILLHDNM